VLTINVHQLGGEVSFQHYSFVAIQERMIPVGVPDVSASCSNPAGFGNHLLSDCYGAAHHRRSDLRLSEGIQTHLLRSCHTPIFDLTSYIHTPSDPEYSLTFQRKFGRKVF